MANHNPRTEQLELGRGKRPKLGHQTVSMRMSPKAKQVLENIAEHYGCTYAGKGWIAGLLEEIGSGHLLVIPRPPFIPDQEQHFDPKAAIDSNF
jgi:hypothetical protein